jgi:hypothetical protein
MHISTVQKKDDKKQEFFCTCTMSRQRYFLFLSDLGEKLTRTVLLAKLQAKLFMYL